MASFYFWNAFTWFLQKTEASPSFCSYIKTHITQLKTHSPSPSLFLCMCVRTACCTLHWFAGCMLTARSIKQEKNNNNNNSEVLQGFSRTFIVKMWIPWSTQNTLEPFWHQHPQSRVVESRLVLPPSLLKSCLTLPQRFGCDLPVMQQPNGWVDIFRGITWSFWV